MPAAQAGSPSPRRPIVVTSTTEYKYGEIGEITGKLEKKSLANVFSGLRGSEVWRGLTRSGGVSGASGVGGMRCTRGLLRRQNRFSYSLLIRMSAAP
jgi:hypothetical protein